MSNTTTTTEAATPASTSDLLTADLMGCKRVGIVTVTGLPNEESMDYITNKKQFQLHSLITEQRHKETMRLSQTIQKEDMEVSREDYKFH